MLQVTREVFEASKGRLKVVGRAGVGVDNVDLAAATEVRCCHRYSRCNARGIPVWQTSYLLLRAATCAHGYCYGTAAN